MVNKVVRTLILFASKPSSSILSFGRYSINESIQLCSWFMFTMSTMCWTLGCYKTYMFAMRRKFLRSADVSLANNFARSLSFRGILAILKLINPLCKSLTFIRYVVIFPSLPLNFSFTCLTINWDSLEISTDNIPSLAAKLRPVITTSYSTSLFIFKNL